MSEMNEQPPIDFLELAGDVVSAYVSNNRVLAAELPAVIGDVHATLVRLANGSTVSASAHPKAEMLTPAQIRKSITPDGLISFLDGKPYKTLKRHLFGHDLDPAGYRLRFGLPGDYPMVAPSYAAKRSELAKSTGLGRIRKQEVSELTPET